VAGDVRACRDNLIDAVEDRGVELEIDGAQPWS
jgi:hypothetical protein